MLTKMRVSLSRQRLLLCLVLALLLVAGLLAARNAAAQTGSTPDLRTLWRRLGELESYHFSADIDQTLRPRPLPENAGQQERHFLLRLEGAAQQDGPSHIDMWAQGNGEPTAPVSLIAEDGRFFLHRDGELQPLDEAGAATMAVADFGGYLAAAREVRLLPETPESAGLTRYAFTISGPRLAAYMREQMTERLRASGSLPPGIDVDVPPALARASGEGELWVDEQGRPRRQIVDLQLPEASEQYDTHLYLVADFYAFNQPTVVAAPRQQADGSWELISPAPTPALGLPAALSAPAVDPAVWVLLATLLLVAAFWRLHRRNRQWSYGVVAALVIAGTVAGPLLQTVSLGRFTANQAEAASASSPLLEALAPAGMAADATAAQPPLAASPAPALAPRQATTGGTAPPVTTCGDGAATNDQDQDGISDLDEGCLGTNPLLADTDEDGLDDNVELEGFTFAGRHWNSDPLRADSNNDGLSDVQEWVGGLGLATEQDPDGDNIPNIYDDDNDGDGVLDAYDISPFHTGTTPVESFSLSTYAEPGSGAQYIDIQVRPANPDHLRFTMTPLDWPADAGGQMRDLDQSPDDVRLTPLLEVRTETVPEPELAERYGAVVTDAAGGGKLIFLPLFPVLVGGSIMAFQTKIAYDLSWDGAVEWEAARLIWPARGTTDNNSGYRGTTRSSATVLHTYSEDLILTGLRVSQADETEVGIFGTPGSPDDDRDLFHFLAGFSSIFLNYQELEAQGSGRSFMEEVELRLNPQLGHIWGLTTTLVAMDRDTYGHVDEAVGRTAGQRLPLFLDAHYGAGSYPAGRECTDAAGAQFRCATLFTAIETTNRSLGMGELATGATTFSGNLETTSRVTQRRVQLNLFERDGLSNQWHATTPARMLEIVEARYGGQYAAIADSHQSRFPGLLPTDVRYFTYLPYMGWMAGQSATASIDDVTLLPDAPNEAVLAGDVLGLAKLLGKSLPGVFLDFSEKLVTDVVLVRQRANQLNADGQEHLIFGHNDTGLEELEASARLRRGIRTNAIKFTVVAAYSGALLAANVAMTTANLVCHAGVECDERALEIANTTVGSLQLAGYAADTAFAIKGAYSAIRALQTAQQASKVGVAVGRAYAVVGIVFAVIAFVIGLAVVWTTFGLTMAANGNNPMVRNMAIATAIVMTVYLTIIFILSLAAAIAFLLSPTGVGAVVGAVLTIIILLISMADLIISLASGGRYNLATLILGLFYEVKLMTEVGEANFRGLQTRAGPGGTTAGSSFTISNLFNGTILKVDGDNGDLRDSQIRGEMRSETAGPVESVVQNGDVSCAVEHRPEGGRHLACSNELAVEFRLITATINAPLEVTQYVRYRIRYADCGLWGTVCEVKHSITGRIPGDPEPARISLDIYPATLDELWSWDALTNPDRDGDGLADSYEESRPDLDAARWDSDGDGLSDGYELDEAGRLGTDPAVADSDGDGLSDGQEYALGTAIGRADSDGDGLDDGAELEGWEVLLPGGSSYRVTSNPLIRDADGDFLPDAVERSNGLSPHGRNEAPRLLLTSPQLASHYGRDPGFYLAPGDPIEFDLSLFNVGAGPISGTLALCLPVNLALVGGADLQGDRSPVTASGNCENGGQELFWSFAGAPLQFGEFVSTTVNAQALSGLNSSLTRQLRASVSESGPLNNIEQTLVVAVDVEDPEVTITTPSAGAYLRGEMYVVGGAASDPTSWVETLTFTAGDGQGAQPVGVAGGGWSYRWTLPADGSYTLQAQATDFVGRQATSAPVAVTVDNTAPTVGADLADGTAVSDLDSGTILLEGLAADNLSGVERVQISIARRPWREVAFDPGNGRWQHDWNLGADAQGEFLVALRAFDRAGNVSSVLERRLIVDREPPVDNLTSRLGAPIGVTGAAIPRLPAGQEITINGWANDLGNVPLPVQPADLSGNLDFLDDATVWLSPHAIADDDGGIFATFVGDVDGDGTGDLAVGLPAAAGGAGRIALLFGRGGDWPRPPLAEALSTSPLSFVGQPGAGLGQMVAPAGDVDGDGFADILVGDPANNRAFLIHGSPLALGQDLLLDASQSAYFTIYLGLSALQGVAAAGDANGDGFDDFFIVDGGSAHLFPGNPVQQAGSLSPLLEAGLEVTGLGPDGGVTAAGDVNGDQLDDFLVSAGGEVRLYSGRGALQAGAGLQLGPAQALATFPSGDAAPRARGLGDIDADGLADVIFSDGAAPAVVRGRRDGGWTVSFDYGSHALAGFLAAPGDVDGDGRADILIGDGGDAYLFLGSDPTAVGAVIAGVGAAASTPYPAAADLNWDGSSDLALIPPEAALAARPELAVSHPFVDPGALPVAGGPAGAEATAARRAPALVAATVRYVDDDANCAGNGPCYPSIGAALNAAGAGDEIVVYPGVYSPFTVGAGRDGLQIRGVNADAVTVDGAGTDFAVRIRNVTGVRLSDLTLRNAASALLLDRAGVGGYQRESDMIELERVLTYDVERAVSMDRTSTLAAADSTFAAVDRSAAITVTGPPDASMAPAWEQRDSLDETFRPEGHLIWAGNSGYALPNPVANSNFYRYTPATNSWAARADTPAGLGNTPFLSLGNSNGDVYLLRPNRIFGSARGQIHVMLEHGDYIYAGGSFSLISTANGWGTETQGIARWNKRTQEWDALGRGVGTPPWPLYEVRALAFHQGHLYVGGTFSSGINRDGSVVYSPGLIRWDEQNGWEAVNGAGDLIGAVDALASHNGRLVIGGDFYDGDYFYKAPEAPGRPAVENPNCWPGPYEVTLFNGTDYFESREGHGGGGGQPFCIKLGPGNYPNLKDIAIPGGNLRNKASSILLGTMVEALACDQDQYTGGCVRLTNHLADLGTLPVMGTNDLNSLQVYLLDGLHNIATYDQVNSAFYPLEGGVDGRVHALTVTPDGSLIAGGAFSSADNRSGTANLATYNGVRWQPRAAVNGPVYALLVDDAARLYVGGDFTRAGGLPAQRLFAIDLATNTFYVAGGTFDNSVRALAARGDELFVGGAFTTASGRTARNLVRGTFADIWFSGRPWQQYESGTAGVVRAIVLSGAGDVYAGGATLRDWTPSYRYRAATNSWAEWEPATHRVLLGPRYNAVTADDGAGSLYALGGIGTGWPVARYDLDSNSWTDLRQLNPFDEWWDGRPWDPAAAAWVDAAPYRGLYVIAARQLVRYNPDTNSWSQVSTNLPFTPADGLAMAWDGNQRLYVNGALPAAFSYHLGRDSWQSTYDSNPGATLVDEGAALARHGEYLYAVSGNADAFGRLGPVGREGTKLDLERVAFVAPASRGAARWLNLDPAPDDFLVENAGNQYAGASTWLPAVPDDADLTLAQADFRNRPAAVYRVRPGSPLTAGYYDPAPDAAVAARCDGAANCFTSIQAAVDSGAQLVELAPGVYHESFYLVSGLDLVGAGAELSVVSAGPGGSSGALISGEGVRDVTVARLGLDGGNAAAGTGIRLDAGAAYVTVRRNLVRNLGTALDVGNPGAFAEVVNNTLVGNGRGLRATGCAGNTLRVRNVIFANHSGTGLSVSNCDPLHQYNLYWDNGTDLDAPGGFSSGEIAADPFFTNPFAGNFRPLPGSPAIDAGDPGTPAPPGAGSRADIGYVEQGQAAVYVDDDYGPGRENDGLTWQVDAFDQIQDGVDAAAEMRRTLGNLLLSGTVGRYAVNVAPGSYTERVTVPSHIDLVGSGAEQTTLSAPAGQAVIFDGVTGSRLRGFRIEGNDGSTAVALRNASNAISITRNLIVGHATGVALSGRASGAVTFNTLVANGAGVRSQDEYTWVAVANNILAANDTGLVTAAAGRINNRYNLHDNAQNFADDGNTGLAPGSGAIVGLDPAFAPAGDYTLTPSSPAVDGADPLAPAIVGGGDQADLGYRELTAEPLALFFGAQAESFAVGVSGVAGVELGFGVAASPTAPVTATLPAQWDAVTLQTPGERTSYWSAPATLAGEGYYRIYTRATDQVGNQEADPAVLFSGQFWADDSAPAVTLLAPADGSTAAAAGLRLSATATDGASQVSAFHFSVNGTLLPAGEVRHLPGSDGRTASFSAERSFAPGTYTIRAIAVDAAGNQGNSTAATVTVGGPANVASITAPGAGDYLNSAQVTASGFARFGSPGGDVTVRVGSGAPVAATLAQPGTLQSAWEATVTLPADGAHTLTPYANGRAGTTVTVSRDTAGPDLTLTTPAAGAFVQQAIALAGTAADGRSGLQQVRLSFDDGMSWIPADLDGQNWSALWESPAGAPTVSYRARIEASDRAGNTTTLYRILTVDNEPPRGIDPVTFNVPEGGHRDDPFTLVMTWTAPSDNSNSALSLLAVDQISETTPTETVNGTSSSAQLATTGAWYVHLGAEDSAGNRVERHYGPWYVGASDSVACTARQQTITLDGLLELAGDEWRAESEFLDDDERGNRRRALYATWDGDGVYVGLQNAWWALDGTFWVYLDDGSGAGTTGPVAPIPGGALPLAATHAAAISGPAAGALWRWDGAAWQPAPGLQFGHSEAGGTELLLPAAVGAGPLRLLAFITDETGAVDTLFPTGNRRAAPWQAVYRWANPCAVGAPNAGQPRAYQLDLGAATSLPGADPLGNGQTVLYHYTLTAAEAVPANTLQLLASAGPGLSYQAASGATCEGCPPGGSSWRLMTGALAPGTTHTVTLSATLDADLSPFERVTATLALSPTAGISVTTTLLVDGRPPGGDVVHQPGNVIGPGPQTITGVATDEEGAGIARVEVELSPGWSSDGAAPAPASAAAPTAWIVAEGQNIWRLPLTVTQDGGLLSIPWRVVDRRGNVSATRIMTLAVDSTPPALTFPLAPVLTGTTVLLGGETTDPAPAGAAVRLVEVMNEAEGFWQEALVYEAEGGSQDWILPWGLPVSDYEVHRLRARATDYGGNVTTLSWQETIIDTVGPRITVTETLTDVLLADYMVYNWPERTPQPLLSGAVADRGGVASVHVSVSGPFGATFRQDAALAADGSFTFIPALTEPFPGFYNLRVEARDRAGNLSQQGIFTVYLRNSPPVCTAAAPDVDTLWPPDRTFRPVNIVGVTDPDGHEVTITIDSIFQDEPVLAQGRSAPDARGVGTATAELRAERIGREDGRVYHLAFTAADGWGGSCGTTVTVGVPPNPRQPAGDGGPLYDATTPGQ